MSNIATKHDAFNNNAINSDEISSYILRFDFNKAAILSLSTAKIEALKKILQRCPDEIQVVGHTCNLGSVSDNQAIGRIRAEEVKDLLVKIGFSAERIQVLSGGQNKPVASNSTLAGRALNRRVVVDCFSQSENNKKRK
jgi:outer membrane protein OmpA-like peptidoglycan-associated protein